MGSPEKPWYTSAIISFLTDDAPCVLGISSRCFAEDVNTLLRRLSAEGESFLTKTLPQLGKSIDLALQGDAPLVTPAFKKRGRTALPAFLSALHRRVFKDDGWVKDEPCLTSIRLLRQMCYWCKKLEKGYSDESLQRATEDFIEIDRSLPSCSADFGAAEPLLAVARAVVWWMFRNMGSIHDHNPGHGPGAVASGADCVQKRMLKVSYSDLESVFRPIPWFRSLRDASEDPDRVLGREKQKCGFSRTEFVPKDSSGPRTIGLEPAEYMWCQQAVKAWMYTHLENASIARGHVNFTDQTINRELARDWRRYETLDMSKASDRNSYALVEYLFDGLKLWPYLRASRTPGTVLPDGRELIYKKFAPMGSAVCFPVQASVYYALSVAALHLSGMPLLLAYRKVYVYGDDLIVPRGYFHVLNDAFESVGLKFNRDKCCTSGRFRESCGLDAYDGVDVTPVRLRCAYPQRTHEVARLVEHTNMLYFRGYRSSASAFERCAISWFPTLSWMKIPRSHRVDLPILTWACEPHEETVRYRTRNSMTTVSGWRYVADDVKCSSEMEMLACRESLARSGPIGQVNSASPTSEFRVLKKRYSGKLRYKRKLAVIRL